MPVHPTARSGFTRASREYVRGRPSYPEGVGRLLSSELHLTADSRLVELGAGTGKFTELLVRHGFDPIALEPVPAMRAELHLALPTVRIAAGVAEALPFTAESLDGFVAAQSFHWFDPARVLPELLRCLRPGGAVALVWNVREDSNEWEREIGRCLDRYRPPGLPTHRTGAWSSAFASEPRFEPMRAETFPHSQSGDLATVLDRIGSVSYVADLPADRRETMMSQVHEIAARAPGASDGRYTLGYRCEVYSTRRVG